jgi:hypothetical protein
VALERRHGHARGAEEAPEGAGLGEVRLDRRRAVGVDVADLRRLQAGVAKRRGDGDLGADALGVEAAAG